MSRRKKTESGGGNNAPWLNTFADLMNLLLCFFVMIFAYSDLNEEKFNELSISMSNSIGVFEAGSTSFGKKQLISSGMTQMSNLDSLVKSVGKSSKGNSDPNMSQNADNKTQNEGSRDEVLQGKEGVVGDKPTEGVNDSEAGGNTGKDQSSATDKEIELEEAINRVQEEKEQLTTQMYDKLSDLREQYNLTGDTELKIDPQFQYVQLDLKGSVLYDSGSATIRKEAETILRKVGTLLKRFEGYEIEIVGHTDNVPMTGSAFKDNNWLSTARALNAAQYLIDNSGIDPVNLKYSGRGEYEPISSNATSEGRARNRRIEIKIYNKYSSR